MKEFIQKMLQIMINKNTTRISFSERFKNIIDQYNAGGSENEDYYEQLLQLIEDMKNEDKRAETEGLTEEELEMFDLLIKGRKLTKEEEQKVKLAAKNLYKKLTEEKQNLFVVDWYKDEQASTTVKDAIISSLDADLPQSFDKKKPLIQKSICCLIILLICLFSITVGSVKWHKFCREKYERTGSSLTAASCRLFAKTRRACLRFYALTSVVGSSPATETEKIHIVF